MAFNLYEFKFPDVGEGITEGTLVEWKVGIGDIIKVDDPLLSVETDKAVVDIPSPVSGKVVELLNKVDDTLTVGNVILTIDVGNNESDIPNENEINMDNNKINSVNNDINKEIIPQKPTEKIATNGDKKYKIEGLPELGKSQSREELNQENKIKSNSNNTNNQNILAMLSVKKYAKENNIDLSKITPTGNHGQITMDDVTKTPAQVETKENKNIETPQEISKVENQKDKQPEIEKTIERPIVNNDKSSIEEYKENIRDSISSPSVRQLAQQKGIDISTISGSGENGRILESDLDKSQNIEEKELGTQTTENENVEIPQEISKVESQPNESKETIQTQNIENHPLNKTTENLTLPHDLPVPYDGIRSAIAKNMSNSLNNTAQVTIFNEICVDELVELRNKEKEILDKQGVKLTYLPFFIKAFIAAAKEYPNFNATTTENSIVLKSDYNIGIAMDTPRGLLVPNIFSAQNKSIIQIAKELSTLIEKGKENKISLDDMANGSFTISSLGKDSGKFFTPILNYPQTAILGIGEISKQPIVVNDEIKIGNVLHLSLTFDHRAIDGAMASQFFKKLCELLKDVNLLLMEA